MSLNLRPQMTPVLVCAIAYAILIIHIWPGTREYEKNWHKISPIKPFIIPDRRAFLCCLLGLYFQSVSSGVSSLQRRNNKGWYCHRNPSDLALTSCTQCNTHTRHHTQTWTHMPEDTVPALVIFVLLPCVVLSVLKILCWAIKAAPWPLMALRLVS